MSKAQTLCSLCRCLTVSRALFALVLKSEAEKGAYLPEFKEKLDSIQPCVDFSAAWEHQRKELREALNALRTKFHVCLKSIDILTSVSLTLPHRSF